jgi:hypothetical protein
VDEFRNRKMTGADFGAAEPNSGAAEPNSGAAEPNSGAAEPNRRRIGTIVHDDRGMASVEWHDAPPGLDRPVLEVLGGPELALKDDEPSYDPYARHTATFPGTTRGNTTRTDLRKLSEWIKTKRALEDRRLRDDRDDRDDEN